MKIVSVSYSKTYHLGDHFFHKIGAEAELHEDDNAIESLTHLKKVVEDFNAETIGQSGFIGIIPTIQKNHVSKEEDDAAFEQLKEALSTFEFREDAQLHLDGTEFKFAIEAKSIVNLKPLKPTSR